MDDEVSLRSSSIETWDTLISKFESFIALGSVFDFEGTFPEDWDFDIEFSSEGSECRRELHSIMEISSIALESTLTLRDFESDIEITIAISATMTFATELDAHTIFDTRGDIDIFFDLDVLIFFSMTDTTLFEYLLAGSMTCATSASLLHGAKNSLYSFSYSTIPLTGFTGFGCPTMTLAGFAESSSFEFYFSSISLDGILE